MENKLFTLEEDTMEFEDLKQDILDRTSDKDIDSLLGNSTIVELPKDQLNSIKALNIEKNMFYKNTDMLRGIRGHNVKLTDDIDERIAKYPDIVSGEVKSNLTYDTFNLLFKRNPVLISKDRMKEPYNITNELIKDMTKFEEFQDLKKETTFDYKSSILAIDSILDYVISSHEELIDDLEKINNLKKEEQNLQNQYNGLKDLDGNTNENMQKIIDNIKEALNDKKQEIKNSNETVKDYVDDNKDTISKNMETGMKVGTKVAKNSKGFFNALGDEFSDKDEKLSDEPLDKKTIANMKNLLLNQRKFERLIKLLGSMVSDATSKAKKRKTLNGSIPDSIKTGNNLPDLLGSSLCYMANPKTKKMFYKNYVEKNLLVKSKIDISSQGPIIVCLDKSGSMGGACKDIWGAAITVACLQSAKAQKRNFRLIRFNNYTDITDFVPKENKKSLPYVLNICTTRCTGGTNFTLPLCDALEAIDSSNFNDASILFITDGEAKLDEYIFKRAKKTKKLKDFRMYTIYLLNDKYSSTNEKIDELSDEIFKLTDLMKEEAMNTAEKIFTEISKI